MSEMKICDLMHNGYSGVVKFADNSRGGWGEWGDKFFVKSDHQLQYNNPHETMKDAKAAFSKAIDEWLETVPKTDAEWLAMLENCVTEDGYEDWHINKTMALRVLELAKKVSHI